MRSPTLRRLIWAFDVLLAGVLVAASYASYRTLAVWQEVVPGEGRSLEETSEREGVRGAETMGDYAVIYQLSAYGEPGSKDVVGSQSGQGEMRLLGVALARGEDGELLPKCSSASIWQQGKVEMVGLGGIVGGWELVRLEEGGAVLRRGDEEKVLGLDAAGEGSGYAVVSPLAKSRSEGEGGNEGLGVTKKGQKPGTREGVGVELSDHVRRVSNVRWEVDRRLLEMIESDTQVSQQVQWSGLILPHKTNGEPDGLEVRGVTENGLLAQLGFGKGDIIVSLNGEVVHGLLDFWGLVPILLKQSSVEIKVLRGGSPLTFYYDVRK